MKILLIPIMLSSFVFADEMQRIESIVNDITTLRKSYEKCQARLKARSKIRINIVEYQKNEDKLKKYKRLLKDEREKNIILKDEIEMLTVSLSETKNQKTIKPSNNKVIKYIEVCSDSKKNEINTFPKLMPKEIKVKKKIEIVKKIDIKKDITVKSGAKTYRVNKDSFIYDSPNGQKLDTWEKNSSFTSNKQTSSWIKITGYFVDKKWQRAKIDLWVKRLDATLR